jgi:hypothetical protein
MNWFRRTVPWAAWCVLFVPLTIVLHELGHYLTAVLAGSPNPALHYSWTNPGDVAAKSSAIGGMIGLAGPAVTIILSAFGCLWIRVRRPARWAFALSVSAVSRFVVAVPYTIVNIGIRLVGGSLRPPAFDEYKAGTALGWSGDALLASTVIVFVVVLVCVGTKLPRGERLTAWTGLVTGTLLGWIFWMLFLGPALLP